MKKIYRITIEIIINLFLLGFMFNYYQSIFQIMLSCFLIYSNLCIQSIKQSSVPNHLRTFKYRILVIVDKVQLFLEQNIFVKIECKSYQNMASTNLVKYQNKNIYFNHKLQFDQDLHYDTNINQFLQRKCEINILIDTKEDGLYLQNVGNFKFNLAQIPNQSSASMCLIMQFQIKEYNQIKDIIDSPQVSNCPMNACQNQSKTSIKTQLSTQQDQVVQNYNHKDVEFETIIYKFQQLTNKIKNNTQNVQRQSDNKCLSNNKQSCSQINIKLLQQLQKFKRLNQDLQFKYNSLEKQKKQLQKVLHQKSFEMLEMTHQIYFLSNKIKSQTIETLLNNIDNHANNQVQANKQNMMKQTIQRQQKQINNLKQQLFNYENQLQYSNFSFANMSVIDTNNDIISQQNIQSDLEKQLAQKCFTIGQLFNIAFQIGGAPLLDKLHNAIGLIEQK